MDLRSAQSLPAPDRPERRVPARAGLGSLGLAIAVLLAACDSGDDAPRSGPNVGSGRQVIVVALDGVEWEVALPLLRAGELPALADLARRGAAGRLRSRRPTLSPILWTSAATGMDLTTHGIDGFGPRDEEEKRLYTSFDRRVPAFWNILTEAGLRSTVVGWWLTYPVEEIRGTMIAQVNTLGEEGRPAEGLRKGALYDDLPGQVHPPERTEEILSVVPQVDEALDEAIRGIFGTPPVEDRSQTGRLWTACRWAFRADETYRRIARKLVQEPFDLFAVYFGGADVMGHRFWRHYRPDLYDSPPTDEEVERFRSLLPAYYRHLDRVIGELVSAAPPGADVIVLSDHGMQGINTDQTFGEDRLRPRLSGGHTGAPPGLFVAAGPSFRALGPLPSDPEGLIPVGSVLDLTPTVLAILGLPVGRDMDGTVLTGVLSDEFLASWPESTVPSHTPEDWEERRLAARYDLAADPERLEQLRGLGYID